MYKCSNCGLGVFVRALSEPIRACNCMVNVEVKPITFLQKIQSFFGKKFYLQKKASIICDITAIAEGKSQFKN